MARWTDLFLPMTDRTEAWPGGTMKVGDCRHYNGMSGALCAAGIDLRQLAGKPNLGWATRLPCFAPGTFPYLKMPPVIVPCAKHEPLSREDVRAREQEQDAAMEQLLGRGSSLCCNAPLTEPEMPLKGRRARVHFRCSACGEVAISGCVEGK